MSTTTTTGTLAAGSSKTFTLAPGAAVSLTLSPNVRVTITESPESVSGSGVGGNTSRVHEPQLPGTFAYGPYAMGGVVVVAVASNSGSSVAWTRKDTVVTTSADGTSLVSGDGVPKVSAQKILGCTGHSTIEEILFEQSKTGKYLMTINESVYGSFETSLSIAEGPVSSLTKTAIAATKTGLYNAAGTVFIDASHNVVGAWWVSETRFLFCGKSTLAGATQNRFYLWLCDYNGGAWKVGNNSTTFDNGRAVLELGLYSGGQATESGILHQRSLAISPSKIVIGEYNVNTSRVAGSTNDAVRVYQSTDSGETWSELLVFNTSGNQIRHCHFVKYDEFTAKWYMGFGDLPDSALLRWDGSSAGPSANTELYDFYKTPGWEVMHDTAGIECRSGDLTIHPQTVYYMSDNGPADTSETYSFQVSKGAPFNRIRSYNFARSDGRDPLIQCEMPNGGAFWTTLSGPLDVGADVGYRAFDIFYSPDGLNFCKVAVTRNNSSAGAASVLFNMFVNLDGQLILSGSSARSCYLTPTSIRGGRGSLVVTVGDWDGSVATLQSTA